MKPRHSSLKTIGSALFFAAIVSAARPDKAASTEIAGQYPVSTNPSSAPVVATSPEELIPGEAPLTDIASPSRRDERAPKLGEPRLDLARGRYVAPLGDGEALLTIDPDLQARLEHQLASWGVPFGVVVLMEPASGRVLALAQYSRAEPKRRDLALSVLSPAASIFKLVTATALLEAGIDPDATVCYHGGSHRLKPKLLTDDPRRDRRCVSLNTAFGHSTNAVFAKLAERDLDAERLRETAGRFLFNATIPFERVVESSPAEIGNDPFEVAEAAAGFGRVRMSPLHGAVLAAMVANGGILVPPRLVDEVKDGPALEQHEPWRVVNEAVAARLADMMKSTVTDGTARRNLGRRVPPALRGVEIAGKTGSLAEQNPYRDHSWFIGYAGTIRPDVAIAVDVVNARLWRVKATRLAREALEIYYGGRVADAAPGRLVRTASR